MNWIEYMFWKSKCYDHVSRAELAQLREENAELRRKAAALGWENACPSESPAPPTPKSPQQWVEMLWCDAPEPSIIEFRDVERKPNDYGTKVKIGWGSYEDCYGSHGLADCGIPLDAVVRVLCTPAPPTEAEHELALARCKILELQELRKRGQEENSFLRLFLDRDAMKTHWIGIDWALDQGFEVDPKFKPLYEWLTAELAMKPRKEASHERD